MGVKERARAKKRKAAVSAKKLTQRARLEHKAVSDAAHARRSTRRLPNCSCHHQFLIEYTVAFVSNGAAAATLA